MNGSCGPRCAESGTLSGIRLMIQASLAFSFMVVGVKLAAFRLPAFEVVFFRSLFGMVMTSYLIFLKKASFLGKRGERTLLMLRGIAGFIALTLHFYSISLLPLGTAVMLNYTGPLFVAILAALFLGERPEIFLISMILISFLGVYLLVGPQVGGIVGKQSLGASLLALLSGFFGAVATLAIRGLRKRVSPLTFIFYFTALSTLGSFFYLPFGFKWPILREWFALAAVAVGSFYGQIWMTLAYRKAPASLVSPFAYLTPLLAFFYGLLFWKEKVTAENFLGGVLIILAGILISVSEAKRSKAPFASA